MTAANAYRAKSATFGSSILGVESISSTINGQTEDLSTDASPTITAVFVDRIAADVTVQTTDIARVATMLPGDTGSLAIAYECRAEGRGATAGNNKAATFANATVVSIGAEMPSNGKGTVSVVFRCSAPGNATPVAWS